VELFVFPDPHQGLANDGAGVIAYVEVGHAAGHRLFPVGHRHYLLPFQGQHDQSLALGISPAGELDAPPVELSLHVVEEGYLEVVLSHGAELTLGW
jgi:hypothetical protein